MMLLHGYQHQGASLGVPTSHSSTSYLQNLGPSRPLYKSGKDDAMISVSGGPPMPSLYGQSISLIPSLNYQGQSNAKRSRSPSPPPQLYHAFKPHNLSSYNSSKLVIANFIKCNFPVDKSRFSLLLCSIFIIKK